MSLDFLYLYNSFWTTWVVIAFLEEETRLKNYSVADDFQNSSHFFTFQVDHILTIIILEEKNLTLFCNKKLKTKRDWKTEITLKYFLFWFIIGKVLSDFFKKRVFFQIHFQSVHYVIIIATVKVTSGVITEELEQF